MNKELMVLWYNGKLPDGYYYTKKGTVEQIHSSAELVYEEFLDGMIILGKVPTFKQICKIERILYNDSTKGKSYE